MMRHGVALVALLVLVLAGCVPTKPVPAPIDQAELDARVAARIDLAWQGTGLDEVVQRPDVSIEAFDATSTLFGDCLREVGLESYSMGEDENGLRFESGGPLDERLDDQLAFYECFARFPFLSFGPGPVLSRAQELHLYDHYVDVLLPCLAIEGHPIDSTFLPTREQFTLQGYIWTPYEFVEWTDPVERDGAVLACGDPYGGLDVQRDYGMFAVSPF